MHRAVLHVAGGNSNAIVHTFVSKNHPGDFKMEAKTLPGAVWQLSMMREMQK